jgi:hypothetical protein
MQNQAATVGFYIVYGDAAHEVEAFPDSLREPSVARQTENVASALNYF